MTLLEKEQKIDEINKKLSVLKQKRHNMEKEKSPESRINREFLRIRLQLF